MNYQNRDEVPNDHKWDLTTRFKTDEDWRAFFNIVKKEIKEVDKYKGMLLKSANNLFEALELKEQSSINLMKLYCYARSKNSENVEDNKYILMLDEITSLYSIYSQSMAYLRPEILSGNKTTLSRLINTKKLKKYKFYLEDILREKDHTLTEVEERLISKLTNTFDVTETISDVLTNSVIEYGSILVDDEELELLNSNYRHIMTNKNRETRKNAFDKLTSKLKKYESIYGINLISDMKRSQNLSEIYKYNSVLEMDLYSSNIPIKVVDNLYKITEKRLDVFRKYNQMIRRALALEKLEYYDINAELVNSNLSFTIEEAKILLTSSLSVLGSDYAAIIKKAFDESWIDFGVYKGKTSAIYATANYGDTPLINANYLGKFTDVSTLAHELGHAVHFYLSMEQPAHLFNFDILVAEVASLTNEILFSNYIIHNSKDKDLKLTAIYNVLHTIQNNLYGACLEGKLENIVYDKLANKEEISSDMLSDILHNLNKEYYGDSVNLTKKSSIMWARRMHYFSPYYLFKYATGVCSAVYIAKEILSGNDKLKEKYIEFLKKGKSNYPTELLKEMGVDLTKPKVINEAINYMDYLIDEFNKISEE